MVYPCKGDFRLWTFGSKDRMEYTYHIWAAHEPESTPFQEIHGFEGCTILRTEMTHLVEPYQYVLLYLLPKCPYIMSRIVDYCDIIYHIPPLNSQCNLGVSLISLMEKVERTQYQAALTLTGTWQGTNRSKRYEELGWETLSDRRWCRRILQIHKIENSRTPSYLRVIASSSPQAIVCI